MKIIYITLMALILYGCDNSDCNYLSAKSFVKKHYQIEFSSYIQKNIEDLQLYDGPNGNNAHRLELTLGKIYKSDHNIKHDLITCRGSLVATYKDKSVSVPIKYRIEKFSTLNVWLYELSPIKIHTLLRVIPQKPTDSSSL